MHDGIAQLNARELEETRIRRKKFQQEVLLVCLIIICVIMGALAIKKNIEEYLEIDTDAEIQGATQMDTNAHERTRTEAETSASLSLKKGNN